MRGILPRLIVAVALALGAGTAVAAVAQKPVAMLSTLTPGGWDIRYRDDGTHSRICLKTGRELIQLRHRAAACDRIVVSESAREMTVHYTCKGAGYGRTQIRKETGSLVQISSQGVANGKPFQFSAEARRTGACAR